MPSLLLSLSPHLSKPIKQASIGELKELCKKAITQLGASSFDKARKKIAIIKKVEGLLKLACYLQTGSIHTIFDDNDYYLLKRVAEKLEQLRLDIQNSIKTRSELNEYRSFTKVAGELISRYGRKDAIDRINSQQELAAILEHVSRVDKTLESLVKIYAGFWEEKEEELKAPIQGDVSVGRMKQVTIVKILKADLKKLLNYNLETTKDAIREELTSGLSQIVISRIDGTEVEKICNDSLYSRDGKDWQTPAVGWAFARARENLFKQEGVLPEYFREEQDSLEKFSLCFSLHHMCDKQSLQEFWQTVVRAVEKHGGDWTASPTAPLIQLLIQVRKETGQEGVSLNDILINFPAILVLGFSSGLRSDDYGTGIIDLFLHFDPGRGFAFDDFGAERKSGRFYIMLFSLLITDESLSSTLGDQHFFEQVALLLKRAYISHKVAYTEKFAKDCSAGGVRRGEPLSPVAHKVPLFQSFEREAWEFDSESGKPSFSYKFQEGLKPFGGISIIALIRDTLKQQLYRLLSLHYEPKNAASSALRSASSRKPRLQRGHDDPVAPDVMAEHDLGSAAAIADDSAEEQSRIKGLGSGSIFSVKGIEVVRPPKEPTPQEHVELVWFALEYLKDSLFNACFEVMVAAVDCMFPPNTFAMIQNIDANVIEVFHKTKAGVKISISGADMVVDSDSEKGLVTATISLPASMPLPDFAGYSEVIQKKPRCEIVGVLLAINEQLSIEASAPAPSDSHEVDEAVPSASASNDPESSQSDQADETVSIASAELSQPDDEDVPTAAFAAADEDVSTAASAADEDVSTAASAGFLSTLFVKASRSADIHEPAARFDRVATAQLEAMMMRDNFNPENPEWMILVIAESSKLGTRHFSYCYTITAGAQLTRSANDVFKHNDHHQAAIAALTASAASSHQTGLRPIFSKKSKSGACAFDMHFLLRDKEGSCHWTTPCGIDVDALTTKFSSIFGKLAKINNNKTIKFRVNNMQNPNYEDERVQGVRQHKSEEESKESGLLRGRK
jgi:hypothetical protein